MDTQEILKRIRKIELSTKNTVNDLFSGEYHSLFKGQGLEFSEVREYQQGDSFRQIDWNVSAKMGSPYIKKFEETRELNVMFLIDTSASTVFGTKSSLKNEFITELTAVLSFSALSNNDKVGMLMFTDEIEKYLPPRKGKKYALRILRDILYFEPKSKKTDINNACEYISRLMRKKSIIFIISDFIDSTYDKALRVLAKKHDVIALKVVDKAEIELPDAGLINIVDPETNEKMCVNTSNKKIAEKYKQIAQAKQLEIEERFKKMGIDLVTLFTYESYIKTLMQFFKTRIKRKNHA